MNPETIVGISASFIAFCGVLATAVIKWPTRNGNEYHKDIDNLKKDIDNKYVSKDICKIVNHNVDERLKSIDNKLDTLLTRRREDRDLPPPA